MKRRFLLDTNLSCIIVKAELMFGARKSQRVEANLTGFELLLEPFLNRRRLTMPLRLSAPTTCSLRLSHYRETWCWQRATPASFHAWRGFVSKPGSSCPPRENHG